MTEKYNTILPKLVQEILTMCRGVSQDANAMCGEHLLADDIIELITEYAGEMDETI